MKTKQLSENISVPIFEYECICPLCEEKFTLESMVKPNSNLITFYEKEDNLIRHLCDECLGIYSGLE